MSTLKSINVQHPSATTINLVNDSSGNVTVGNNLTVTGTSTLTGNVTAAGTVAMGSSFKRNRIINGNMLIDQRNAGASVANLNNNYTLDRWQTLANVNSKFTVQQNAGSVTPPAGFTKYLGVTSSAATTVGASDYYSIYQPIEANNVGDLGWGAAGAQTVTLSFWVRSSLTGAFGGAITNNLGTYSYPFSYSIGSANTWTQISITVAGPTAGTWGTGNASGPAIIFGLGVGTSLSGTAGTWTTSNYLSATGAVSVVGTSGATWYVTGVQLEVGTKATPYEMQIYSDQLFQCQRYYQITKGNIYNAFASLMGCPLPFFATMRASPTATASGGSAVNVAADYIENLTTSGGRYSISTTASGYYVDRTIALAAEL